MPAAAANDIGCLAPDGFINAVTRQLLQAKSESVGILCTLPDSIVAHEAVVRDDPCGLADERPTFDHSVNLRQTRAVTFSSARHLVTADEGQFVLADPSGAELGSPSAVDLSSVRFHADNAMSVSILTGAQWGRVEVVVEELGAAPTIDERWEEVAEISVRCSAGLVIAELMGEPVLVLCRSGGDYACG